MTPFLQVSVWGKAEWSLPERTCSARRRLLVSASSFLQPLESLMVALQCAHHPSQPSHRGGVPKPQFNTCRTPPKVHPSHIVIGKILSFMHWQVRRHNRIGQEMWLIAQPRAPPSALKI
jgi:hypothetical protein